MDLNKSRLSHQTQSPEVFQPLAGHALSCRQGLRGQLPGLAAPTPKIPRKKQESKVPGFGNFVFFIAEQDLCKTRQGSLFLSGMKTFLLSSKIGWAVLEFRALLHHIQIESNCLNWTDAKTESKLKIQS